MRLLVIGCGLAGAAIAWAAHRRGWSLTLVDRIDPQSSSHVAAGLVTPITGSRSAATWRWDSFFEFAATFYPEIESRTRSTFWYPQPAIRLFGSSEERDRALERWSQPPTENESPLRPQISILSSEELDGFHAPFGGCRMEPAARLDTTTYLRGTREFFQEQGAFFATQLNMAEQLPILPRPGNHPLQLELANQSITADAVVFCQGFDARSNEWFSSLPLHPARGDILTLTLARDCEVGENASETNRRRSVTVDDAELPSLARTHVIHSDAWMVPTDGKYLVGATYDRHHLNGQVEGVEYAMDNRRVLLERLSNTLPWIGTERWNLEQHRAAVRPASYDRHPLIGRHPWISNAYTLNGLGSKGSLMAPLLAHQLCDSIEIGEPIDPFLDWRRRGNTE